MKIVVDTNIVFSTLRNSNPIRDGVFFSNPNHIEIFTTAKLWFELHKPKQQKKLHKNNKRHSAEIESIENYLQSRIITIAELDPVFFNIADDLCRDIDHKDINFLALALQLGCPLWTGDESLIDGLTEKGINIFFEPRDHLPPAVPS
jgi:predicted nucleic acid-binding protein